MALIRNGTLTADPYTAVADDGELPAAGAVLLSLEQWQQWRGELLQRDAPLGVRLRSDQHPEVLAGDLHRLALVALEFPTFRDGRAYSYARVLRQRYGFTGELRAVGEVLQDQLLYMHRVGFDAFDIESTDPEGTFAAARAEFSVWYQPAADNRIWAARQRHPHAPDSGPGRS
jgi:uncharacterized protein (DUF934 family)